MLAKAIAPGLYSIPVGPVNTFLFTSPEGDTLVDTGLPGSAPKIIQALRELDIEPRAIHHILLTHAHPDHIGGLAALKQATGAAATMHPLDAPIAISGAGFRRMRPAPGLRTGILFRMIVQRASLQVESAPIDRQIHDGDRLPLAGGLTAIHIPGHCAGQVAFLWEQHGGVLIAADACSNVMGLGWSLGYEDIEEGKRSLKKLAALDFQIACFGHGAPLTRDASAQFKNKWG